MPKKYPGVLLRVFIVAILFLALNYALLYVTLPYNNMAGFTYSLPLVYGFFFVFSALILLALFVVSAKSAAQTGYAYLVLSSIKMAAAYFMARPILGKVPANQPEKFTFFFVFLLFLAIEVFYAARLLNNKQ